MNASRVEDWALQGHGDPIPFEGITINTGDFQGESLGGGVRLFVRPTSKFKTTTIKVFVHRQLDEHAAQAALIPFLLRRGCGRWPSLRDITKELELLYGASLGVDTLKLGERQILCFRLDLLGERFNVGRRSLLSRGTRFLSEVLWNPLSPDGESFVEESFVSEKRNLRHSVESIVDEKIRYATERLVQEMCKGEPFALHEYGDLESIDRLTNPSTFAFYRETLATSPIDLFVVGDVDPAQIREELIEKTPLGKRSGPFCEIPEVVRKRPHRTRTVIEEKEVSQAKLVMGYRTPLEPTSKLFPALMVANAILGGGTYSKLFKNVREREQLAYYANSSLERIKGILIVQSGIPSERSNTAVKVIQRQFSDLRRGRVSEEELDGAKKALLNRYRTAEDSPGRMINDSLEAIISGRRPSGRVMMRSLSRISVDDVVDASKTLRLDTAFLLREKSARAPRGSKAARASLSPSRRRAVRREAKR